jgi:hypothetical protein
VDNGSLTTMTMSAGEYEYWHKRTEMSTHKYRGGTAGVVIKRRKNFLGTTLYLLLVLYSPAGSHNSDLEKFEIQTPCEAFHRNSSHTYVPHRYSHHINENREDLSLLVTL